MCCQDLFSVSSKPEDATLPADTAADDPPTLGGQRRNAPGFQFSSASHGSAQILSGISFSSAQCVCLLPLPAQIDNMLGSYGSFFHVSRTIRIWWSWRQVVISPQHINEIPSRQNGLPHRGGRYRDNPSFCTNHFCKTQNKPQICQKKPTMLFGFSL